MNYSNYVNVNIMLVKEIWKQIVSVFLSAMGLCIKYTPD